jgi:hypothetical protein
LYTGTLKSGCLQRSNFRRLKNQFKIKWRRFAIGALAFLKFLPIPSRNALRNAVDIINCTPEEFLHQMVITKNIFKDTVVSDSRGSKHCITTLTKLGAGNTVIPQDFEQWTSKERQGFISILLTWALCYNQVDWVNVGIDPHHLEDRDGNEYSASYRGKAFQIMEGMVIYHDLQVARNHLEKPKK